jgi:hypothetical protein
VVKKESYKGQYLKPVLARNAASGRLDGGESEGSNKKLKKQAAE